MREIKSPKEMYQYSLRQKSHEKRIGFVPTMGALHEGHLALIEAAKKRADIVIVSIFVNPIQFGPSDDLAHYPRNLERDKKLLKGFAVDALFVPEAKKILPSNFKSFVEVDNLSKKLCGRSRPGHFRGVTTIVAKLFNIVIPDVAVFGEKDYQQLLLIRQMTRDLDFPIEIVSVPTVREFDGLAKSSRNGYLNPRERKSAAILYKSLSFAQREIAGGERDLNKILFRMRAMIGSEPTMRLDYLTAVDPQTLEEVKHFQGKMLFAVAAHVGKARLIDNIIVGT